MLENLPKKAELYIPEAAPSSVTESMISETQLDQTFYSSCSDVFVLEAMLLAFDTPANCSDNMRWLIANMHCEIKESMCHTHSAGYCWGPSLFMREEGITAVLASNISKAYTEYCRIQNRINQDSKTVIMHQPVVSQDISGEVDIGLFYRFETSDDQFIHKCKALMPMIFIEFTKTTTKSLLKKLPQASAYANSLLRHMKFTAPLLGIVMSESEYVMYVYNPKSSSTSFKIAEIEIIKRDITEDSLLQLLHVMSGWVALASNFMSSSDIQIPYNSLHRKNSIKVEDFVYKAFDYRSTLRKPTNIRERCEIPVEERRCPKYYIESDLNAEMVVEWTNPLNMKDTLAIIRYLYVEGSHEPSTVQHFYILITKIIVLHLQGIVHGDLRFANVVFGLNQSTLLDYDYSGKNRTYPPNFNLVIIIFLISLLKLFLGHC